MTMMAGFDLVLEIAPSFVAKLAQFLVRLGAAPSTPGVPLRPPFDLPVNVTGTDFSAQMDLLVLGDLSASFATGDSGLELTFTLPFADSSIRITAVEVDERGRPRFSPASASALAGLIEIRNTVPLGAPPAALPLPPPPTGGSSVMGSFDLSTATVELLFQEAARERLEIALRGSPISGAAVVTSAQDALEARFRSQLTLFASGISLGQRLPITPVFTVMPSGAAGSPLLLQVTATPEAHPLIGEDPSAAVLGIFAMLLPGSTVGRWMDRTEGPVVAEVSDLALSVGPQAFVQAVFCPGLPGLVGLPTGVGVSPPPLPPACGTGPPLALPGTDYVLTRIDARLTRGQVSITGQIADSGFCYEAAGDFRTEVQFEVSPRGDSLQPRIVERVVVVDVDLDEWCWLALAALTGPIELAVAVIVNDIVEGLARDRAAEVLLGISPPAVGLPALALLATRFTQVDVTAEAFTLHAAIDLPLSPRRRRSIELGEPTVVEQRISEEEGEPFVTELPCVAGEYPVTVRRSRRRVRLEATASLVGQPLQWSLYNGPEQIHLPDTEGTAEIPRVLSHFDAPLPEGSDMHVTARVRYAISGDAIELENIPEDGDYSITVAVRGSESEPGSGPVAFKSVHMRGMSVVAEGYAERWRSCVDRYERHELPDRGFFAGFPPRWRLADRLPDEELVLLLVETLTSPRADEFLAMARPVLARRIEHALASSALAGSDRFAPQEDQFEMGPWSAVAARAVLGRDAARLLAERLFAGPQPEPPTLPPPTVDAESLLAAATDLRRRLTQAADEIAQEIEGVASERSHEYAGRDLP